MSGVQELSPGLYSVESLPRASTKHLVPYATDSWAGMDVLHTTTGTYPHTEDILHGDSLAGLDHESLRAVGRVISGELFEGTNLRWLSFQVGQALGPDHDCDVQAWERKVIGSILEKVDLGDGQPCDAPTKSWGTEHYQELYERIRAAETRLLRVRVSNLAGVIIATNETRQLYVQRENGLKRGTGWLAPLLGVAVDAQINQSDEQVHDVIPVIRQNNDVLALLRGAGAGLYMPYMAIGE